MKKALWMFTGFVGLMFGISQAAVADEEFAANVETLQPYYIKEGAHHWLILHGRYTCKARKPICTECVIDDLCEFKGKNR